MCVMIIRTSRRPGESPYGAVSAWPDSGEDRYLPEVNQDFDASTLLELHRGINSKRENKKINFSGVEMRNHMKYS